MTAPPTDAIRTGKPPAGVSRAGPLKAACVAGLACSAVHLVFLASSKGSLAPAYLALCAGLSLTLAAALGGLALWARRSSAVCLVAWVALAGWLEGGAAGGGAMALAGVLGALAGRRGRDLPSLNGLLAGGGFGLAILAAPRLAARLGEHAPHAAFLAALGFLGIWGAGRWVAARLAGRVSETLLVAGAAALLVAVSAKPLFDGRWSRSVKSPSDALADAPEAPAAGPDIVLLVLDTVRADHLSVYGYGRETTPELAALLTRRPEARVHPMALANGTWTVPSHASLFTGLPPSEHGAQFGRAAREGFAIHAERTLAEALGEVGYRTLSVFANPWLMRVKGMGRGFDVHLLTGRSGVSPPIGERLREALLPSLAAGGAHSGAGAAYVNALLLEAVDGAGSGPLFLFANYVDAHAPYLPPREFRGRFAPWSPRERPEHLALAQPEAEKRRLEARYDECIAGLDRDLGLLFAELERRGRLADAWIFVTSDHGEAFGEHGVTEHGTTVYGEVTRVPLLLFPPAGVALGELGGAASLVDVAATIAAIARTDWPGGGRDLRGGGGAAAPPVLIEFYGDPRKARDHGELARQPARALVDGFLKLVSHGGPSELYDLAADPGELRDLAGERAHEVQRLEALLGEWDAVVRDEVHWEGVIPPSELEALRKMGYLGGDED